MTTRSASLLLLLLTYLASCTQPPKNPPAPGFDEAGSDARAIEIADQVMTAMGGREAWDNTRLIAWNFFGNRKLIWDKASGQVRVDNLKDDQTVLLNINTDQGRVFRQGRELANPDSVARYVKQGKSDWINDMYWLLMPFKLKDSGLTLKYAGKDTVADGKLADRLQLTFKGVGDTPGNKYDVWVDQQTHLVSQWAYYPTATDKTPGFTLPWSDYQKHGGLLLSGDRGENDLTDIQVFSDLPPEVFTTFTRPDLTRYAQAN
ncbi:MAG: hypothetical protein H7319_04025 [Spirosoma sp.]|nr:hypothetical protein [Spirosoma sp.]